MENLQSLKSWFLFSLFQGLIVVMMVSAAYVSSGQHAIQ